MELEKKRKREDNNGKRRKVLEDDGGGLNAAAVMDEEVEEFFAILKRIHVAVKYFKERDGGRRDLTAAMWSLSIEGVERYPECSGAGLDLNCEPDPDDSSPLG
ncbi:hypothetical protein CASFOL_020640 [Castilleja foliolosa]|uniref:Uncharacterized protein n=1 Tax=Castilleja foliolosa TaxID=1961234 RepID=A0ABD3D260_9LAMI